jgi:hypothetical protein
MDSNQSGAESRPEVYRRDRLGSGSRRPLRRDEGHLPAERFDQKLDRWVSAGRQIVNGVTGARPGGRGDERGAAARPDLAGVGRWVENKIDWLLEDTDDWREPWQEPAAAASPPFDAETSAAPPVMPGRSDPASTSSRSAGRPRTPLEAISRRGGTVSPGADSPAAASSPADQQQSADEWPDDDTFTLPRWQRAASSPQPVEGRPSGRRVGQDAPGAPRGSRPLPRSSRRR